MADPKAQEVRDISEEEMKGQQDDVNELRASQSSRGRQVDGLAGVNDQMADKQDYDGIQQENADLDAAFDRGDTINQGLGSIDTTEAKKKLRALQKKGDKRGHQIVIDGVFNLMEQDTELARGLAAAIDVHHEEDLAQYKAQLDDLADEVGNVNLAISKQDVEISDLGTALDKMAAAKEHVKTARNQAVGQAEELRSSNQALERKVKELDTAALKREETISSLRIQNNSLEQDGTTMQTFKTELAQKRKDYQDLSAQHNKLQGRYDALQEQQGQQEQQSEGEATTTLLSVDDIHEAVRKEMHAVPTKKDLEALTEQQDKSLTLEAIKQLFENTNQPETAPATVEELRAIVAELRTPQEAEKPENLQHTPMGLATMLLLHAGLPYEDVQYESYWDWAGALLQAQLVGTSLKQSKGLLETYKQDLEEEKARNKLQDDRYNKEFDDHKDTHKQLVETTTRLKLCEEDQRRLGQDARKAEKESYKLRELEKYLRQSLKELKEGLPAGTGTVAQATHDEVKESRNQWWAAFAEEEDAHEETRRKLEAAVREKNELDKSLTATTTELRLKSTQLVEVQATRKDQDNKIVAKDKDLKRLNMRFGTLRDSHHAEKLDWAAQESNKLQKLKQDHFSELEFRSQKHNQDLQAEQKKVARLRQENSDHKQSQAERRVELESVEQSYDDASAELENANRKLTVCETESGTKDTRIGRLESEVKTRDGTIDQMTAEKQRFIATTARQEKQIEMNDTNIAKLEKQVREKTGQATNAHEVAMKARDAAAAAEEKAEGLKATMEAAEGAKRRAEEARDASTAKVEQISREQGETEERMTSARRRMKSLEDEASKAFRDQTTADQKLTKLEEELQAAQDQERRAQEAGQTMEVRYTATQNAKEAVEAQAEEAEKARQTAEEAQKASNDARQKVEELKQAAVDKAKEFETAKHDAEAKQEAAEAKTGELVTAKREADEKATEAVLKRKEAEAKAEELQAAKSKAENDLVAAEQGALQKSQEAADAAETRRQEERKHYEGEIKKANKDLESSQQMERRNHDDIVTMRRIMEYGGAGMRQIPFFDIQTYKNWSDKDLDISSQEIADAARSVMTRTNVDASSDEHPSGLAFFLWLQHEINPVRLSLNMFRRLISAVTNAEQVDPKLLYFLLAVVEKMARNVKVLGEQLNCDQSMFFLQSIEFLHTAIPPSPLLNTVKNIFKGLGRTHLGDPAVVSILWDYVHGIVLGLEFEGWYALLQRSQPSGSQIISEDEVAWVIDEDMVIIGGSQLVLRPKKDLKMRMHTEDRAYEVYLRDVEGVTGKVKLESIKAVSKLFDDLVID